MFRDCHANKKNQPYWPCFKKVIGVIDGMHVSCVVSVSDKPMFIESK